MKIDTGWDVDRIDLKYGTQLGFTTETAVGKFATHTSHFAELTVGTLKPITTELHVSLKDIGYNIFGLLPMRQYDKFIITRSNATITDSTTGGGTLEGYIAARKDFEKYSHISGTPVLVDTAKKQALFASMVRGNSQAYWRSRI